MALQAGSLGAFSLTMTQKEGRKEGQTLASASGFAIAATSAGTVESAQPIYKIRKEYV